MGANNGTGQPYWFRCSACRRTHALGGGGHVKDVALTGKTRKYTGGNRGPRGSRTHYQYVCHTCGHEGWSRHVELERKAENVS